MMTLVHAEKGDCKTTNNSFHLILLFARPSYKGEKNPLYISLYTHIYISHICMQSTVPTLFPLSQVHFHFLELETRNYRVSLKCSFKVFCGKIKWNEKQNMFVLGSYGKVLVVRRLP